MEGNEIGKVRPCTKKNRIVQHPVPQSYFPLSTRSVSLSCVLKHNWSARLLRLHYACPFHSSLLAKSTSLSVNRSVCTPWHYLKSHSRHNPGPAVAKGLNPRRKEGVVPNSGLYISPALCLGSSSERVDNASAIHLRKTARFDV